MTTGLLYRCALASAAAFGLATFCAAPAAAGDCAATCGDNDRSTASRSVTIINAGDHHKGKSKDKGKPDIVDIAAGNDAFSTLVTLVKAADLVDALKGEGPLTVFAPTNDAFAKIDSDVREALLEPRNKRVLQRILKYHVIAGDVSAAGAIKAGKAKTLLGQKVAAEIRDGRLFINDARTVKTDIDAANGTIHVIESVLIPEGVLDDLNAGRLVIGVFTDEPSDALRSQLGLGADQGLVVTGLSRDNARDAGLQELDVILTVNGERATTDELNRQKNNAGPGGTVRLEIARRGRLVELDVPVVIERH
jgi:uncharacterized surface protein with fasciclin (FAS1) repeats